MTINRAKICLSSQTRADRLQIKGKIFDYLACGAFCLTDANPELLRFVPESCLATYRDIDECVAQIERFLKDDGARDRIARAGRAWFENAYDYRAFWRAIAAALIRGPDRLPMVPGIEDVYREFTEAQPLVGRAQLAALSQLAHIVAQAGGARRLPVRALGSHRGMNILSIDGRFIVATDGLELDFMEIGGELHALLPETGLVKIAMGEPIGSRAMRLVRSASVEAAKRIIETLAG